jgi:hypothetical protein
MRTETSGPKGRGRIVLWIAMIVGIVSAGTAFVYKIAEFMFTLSSDEVPGFADMPVTLYFIVATGWLAILAWCFLTGKFTDMEKAKWEMIEKEEAYERGE